MEKMVIKHVVSMCFNKWTQQKIRSKAVPALKHHTMKPYRESKHMPLHIFNLNTQWKCVDRFTLWPLYPLAPTEEETGWAPKPVWMLWWTPHVQPRASHLSVLILWIYLFHTPAPLYIFSPHFFRLTQHIM